MVTTIKKIAIAHEHPLALTREVEASTDTSFYIATICASIPEYFEHAKQDKKHKILDCGTFEEGYPMDNETYITYIKAINPEEFVIPDHLFDKDKTLESAMLWLDLIKKHDLKGLPIVVVQGKNLEEHVECYLELVKHFDKIAIPYDLQTPDKTPTQVVRTEFGGTLEFDAGGRFKLIKHLVDNDLLDRSKQYHFLGMDTTIEFTNYMTAGIELSFVDSIDTSSPVLHGLKGIAYNSDHGLLVKNRLMMKELILEKDINEIQKYLIQRNIAIFKAIMLGASDKALVDSLEVKE